MGKLTDGDTNIVAHIQSCNRMEIEAGKLAEKRASAPVKRYAEQIVRDHQTSETAVTAFAKARGLDKIPEAKPTTEAEKNDMKAGMNAMSKLKTLKGAEFDREYLRLMVEGHEKDLAKTEPEMAAASDPELKKMLDGRKMTLQRHADGARELLKQAGSTTTPQSGGPSDTSPTPNSSTPSVPSPDVPNPPPSEPSPTQPSPPKG